MHDFNLRDHETQSKLISRDQGATIFSWNNGISSEVDPYVGRIHLIDDPTEEFGKASVNLTAIRDTDAGWFECRVLFPNRIPSSSNNGTWYYLSVNGMCASSRSYILKAALSIIVMVPISPEDMSN